MMSWEEEQDAAAVARWRVRHARDQRLITVSLAGFNLGMVVFDVSFYVDQGGWGFLLAAFLHVLVGGYAAWQLWRALT